jgi:predicted proteasome-type protease
MRDSVLDMERNKWSPVYGNYSMTLTVALSVKDGMVFATDSRGTIGDPRGLTAQNDSIKKMYVIGKQTVLQMSGANETGSMIINEIMQMNSAQTIISTTDLMNKSREILIKRYDEWFKHMSVTPIPNSGTPEKPALNITIAGFDKIGEDIEHRIYLLSHFNNFAPQLFNTKMCLTGVPQYAIYLSHRLFSPEMSIENALSLAAYVITETATQDGKVGGPLQLMYLKKDTNVIELTTAEVQKIVTENNERSNKLKKLFFSEEKA